MIIDDGLSNQLNHHGRRYSVVGERLYTVVDDFTASIMVFSLKMIAFGWLFWDSASRGEQNTAGGERVDFVGRWSMISVLLLLCYLA